MQFNLLVTLFPSYTIFGDNKELKCNYNLNSIGLQIPAQFYEWDCYHSRHRPPPNTHTLLHIWGLVSTLFTGVISAAKEGKPLLPHSWEVLRYCNFYYFSFLTLLLLLMKEFPSIFQIIFSNQTIQDLSTGLIFSGPSAKEPTAVPKSRHYQAI